MRIGESSASHQRRDQRWQFDEKPNNAKLIQFSSNNEEKAHKRKNLRQTHIFFNFADDLETEGVEVTVILQPRDHLLRSRPPFAVLHTPGSPISTTVGQIETLISSDPKRPLLTISLRLRESQESAAVMRRRLY